MDVSDRLAIEDLLARAAYALDERDLAMLEACFAEKATMIIDIDGVDGVSRFEGRAAIMGIMKDSIETQTDRRRHVTTNTMLVTESDGEASFVSNLTLTAVEDGVIRLVTSGLYRDRVRRVGDAWVIAERRIDLDMPY